MHKSEYTGVSKDEVEKENIITTILELAPKAEKVYGEITTLLADPKVQELEKDAVALFEECKSLLGTTFKIS